MFQRVLGFATVMSLLVASIGCGSGYSEQKATQRCDQELASKGQCVTEAAYDACLTCYTTCGSQCKAQATCAETYQCGADPVGEGGSAGSGGSGGAGGQ